jgi:hypothetical protein
MSILVIIGGLATQKHANIISRVLSTIPPEVASDIKVVRNLKSNMVLRVENIDVAYMGEKALTFLENFSKLSRSLQEGERYSLADRSDVPVRGQGVEKRQEMYDMTVVDKLEPERLMRRIQPPYSDADAFGPSTDPTSVKFQTHRYNCEINSPISGLRAESARGETAASESRRLEGGHLRPTGYLNPRTRFGVVGQLT